MIDLKSVKWEESYDRMENFIFYPQAEVVKFLNRFIRKKTGINQFRDILNPGLSLTALDFGCGIGRNVLLFEEFGIKGYGIDISVNAITKAKELANYSYPGDMELQNRFSTTDGMSLPYQTNFFDFAVSDSVLDSMYFDVAVSIIKELDRTVKKYLFITLISDPNVSDDGDKEIIVESKHENGTVQGFFTFSKIERLIEDTNWKIKWISLITDEVITTQILSARYYAVLEK